MTQDLKDKIIELRKDGCTYNFIQYSTGNVSKKDIRKVLLEEDSILVDPQYIDKKWYKQFNNSDKDDK